MKVALVGLLVAGGWMLVAAQASAQNSPSPEAGIQWFATWESGLREAQRSGRPILLVAAAPHCAGVSGIW